jgi:AcrR family transcriptional regulator
VAAVNSRGAGVGMDDISSASGIAKPVFYRYFSDKADLFLEVARSVAQVVVTEVMAAIDEPDEPRAKLEAGIGAYIAAIEAQPALYEFAAAQQGLGRSVTGESLDDYASIIGVHASRVIGGYLRAAGLDSGAAEPWGFGIVGMVRSATDRWLTQQSMTHEALVTYLTDLVWPGLVGTATAAATASGQATGQR